MLRSWQIVTKPAPVDLTPLYVGKDIAGPHVGKECLARPRASDFLHIPNDFINREALSTKMM